MSMSISNKNKNGTAVAVSVAVDVVGKKRSKSQKTASNDAIVFIDLSNYIFQRYFAINTWAKMSGHIFAEGEPGRKEFLERYCKMFESNLLAMQKKLKFEWKNVYFAIDCPREKIWRNKKFPEYKKNRDLVKKLNIKPIDTAVFPLTYDVIIPGMNDKNNGNIGYTMLRYPTAEADDIVGVLHKKIRMTQPTRNIIIITNDNDYLQLMDDYTRIMNANFKELKERLPIEIIANPSSYIIYKAIKGDESDNIPPIINKIGEKVALRLAFDPVALEEKIRDPVINAAYMRNRLLVNFDCIPTSIRNGINALI